MTFFADISFAEMTTPTLVVAGDNDVSRHLTVRGADCHADPYALSPGPKSLLTLYGVKHRLGGVSGYAAENMYEEPERVAAVQRFTWAYLRTTLPRRPCLADCVRRAGSAQSAGEDRMQVKLREA